MKKLTTFLHFLLMTIFVQAQSGSYTQIIRGTVLDEQSGSILPGASITIADSKLNGIANDKGAFKIQAVPVGRQSIKVSMSGYEDGFIASIEVTSSKEVVLEIRLKEKVTKLDDVVLKAGKS